MKWLKKLFYVFVIGIVLSIGCVVAADQTVRRQASGKLYSSADAIPYNKVALLLGTGKFLRNGTVNPYYRYRIEATAALFRAGKARYLIISGDNGREGYNEPEEMRRDLMALGLDSSRIYLDYAGFRTFDSMVRLKKIFGQDSVTVISQAFHNERALYLASKEGIHAIGFNAEDVAASKGWKVALREKGARVKVFLDLWFGQEPRFLGTPVVLPE